ncbi:dTDP-4-dehydrorhamnose 3,5-epimerase [Billgrantia montanilacus]|uniref:dTDP-4-dehydrorhamnose 3,5-epimerase n=1 Tax=Billgrantia montanilacus TaxID=2282305 RepID=A0A368U352_9GAMM|nr:dTDP-4-dehydrorhamnose 3,5-epimerase [Halomonas montanilacus]RCV90917.1 dTDP-4-dehydrorhamnose 3,5-epimerase [Halomonas montanilacus]
MKINTTPISDLMVIESTPHTDLRGAFARLFCDNELAPVIGRRRIVQINHSTTSTVGTIRGLHFQHPPHAEMKLVRCLKGRVWDVAIDLRRDSPTFLNWYAQELAADNHRMMVIPEGFAHGFQTLEPDSEVFYLTTAHYMPNAEGGVRFDDPRLGVKWPLKAGCLSVKDAAHPLLDEGFHGIFL